MPRVNPSDEIDTVASAPREEFMRIEWHKGEPPESERGKRLLLIAHPTGNTHDAAADNRPDIYIGHFGHAEDGFVPARIWGMSANEARPALNVKYWAEIDLPADVELHGLTVGDFSG
jgi:hypothetical protein